MEDGIVKLVEEIAGHPVPKHQLQLNKQGTTEVIGLQVSLLERDWDQFVCITYITACKD